MQTWLVGVVGLRPACGWLGLVCRCQRKNVGNITTYWSVHQDTRSRGLGQPQIPGTRPNAHKNEKTCLPAKLEVNPVGSSVGRSLKSWPNHGGGHSRLNPVFSNWASGPGPGHIMTLDGLCICPRCCGLDKFIILDIISLLRSDTVRRHSRTTPTSGQDVSGVTKMGTGLFGFSVFLAIIPNHNTVEYISQVSWAVTPI